MKLQWPTKDYTEEEIMSVHGDERNRRLIANDNRTIENLHAISFIVMMAVLITGLIYILWKSL